MVKCCFKYRLFTGALVFLLSCSNTNNKPVIKFSNNGSAIVIKNIDEVSLLQVKNAYQLNPDASKLFSVLITPGDQDSLQTEHEISGKIKLQGDSLFFYPDSPFVKGKSYLVETYVGVQYASAKMLLTGEVKHNLTPQQQILNEVIVR